MYRNLLKGILIIITLFNSTVLLAKEDVEFYIYYDKPPFVIDKEKNIGLSYDFISALNDYSEKYHYLVSYAPKQRAISFAKEHSGVLWTTPIWVEDPKKEKYAWIEDLIFESEQYITNDPDLVYKDVNSLAGKIVVGVRGYSYFNLEQAFNDNLMTRVDVHNEKIIPLMLLRDRADVGIIGMQTYEYLKRSIPEMQEKLYVLKGYKKYFYRSILIDKSKMELKQDIEKWINSPKGRAQWQALKEKWLYNPTQDHRI